MSHSNCFMSPVIIGALLSVTAFATPALALITIVDCETSLSSGIVQIEVGQSCETIDNIDLLGTSYNKGLLTNIDYFKNPLDNLFTNEGDILNRRGMTNYGEMRNTGTIDNRLNLNNWGTLTNDGTIKSAFTLNNSSLLKNNDTITNTGDMYNGGTIENDGIITNGRKMQNSTTGVIKNHDTITNNSLYLNYGILDNDGTVNNNVRLINSHTINNLEGGDLNNAYTFDNNLSLNNSGTVTNDGTLTNYEGGVITNDGTITNNDTLINYGTLNNNAQLDNNRILNNYGPLNNAGIIHIKTGGNFTSRSISTNLIDGEIDVDNGAILTIWGTFNNDGAIKNTGSLQNNGGFYNRGSLVNDGRATNERGAAFYNSGILDNNGGIGNRGVFNNVADGEVNNYGTLSNTARMTNDGMINNHNTLNNNAILTNNGTINNLEGAEINLTQAASLDTLGGTVINNGTINRLDKTVIFTGALSGSGTINADIVQISGTANVGNSPGLMSLNADVEWLDGATIMMEIAGNQRGISYDSFNIFGDLDIAAGVTLDVDLLDLYGPLNGQWFDLAYISGSYTGEFDFTTDFWDMSYVDLIDNQLGFQHALRVTYTGLDQRNPLADVPEPAPWALLSFGLLGIGYFQRKSKIARP